MSTKTVPTGINKFWMPFTDNYHFRQDPQRIFTEAKGLYYYTNKGEKVLDAMSGLWCSNAGHCHPKIVEAIQKQAAKLDYAPAFNSTHPLSCEFAERIIDCLPENKFSQVFFTMCGSTAVDSALKIALQYQRSRGEGGRVRFIGRERGYHGVGFGGISVGGLAYNRKAFSSNLLPHVDHLPHTHSLPHMAFSRGEPTWGLHLADELERIVALHGAETIAAVIVEPVAGSTGVLPPPVGYLKRLREICNRHDILLIFDEVITGFGRVGEGFATTKFDVIPDMITCAKGMTNAAVPAGGVICAPHIFDAISHSAHKNPGWQIEMFHGYTYSGHPLAMAAGIATLDVMQEEKMWENCNNLAPYYEEKLHSTLPGLTNVVDVRNYGLMGGIEVSSYSTSQPSLRADDIFKRCFAKGVFVRYTGTTIATSPPLSCSKEHLDRIVNTLAEAIVESNNELKPPSDES